MCIKLGDFAELTTQVCSIQMKTQPLDMESIALVPGQMMLNENTELTMYVITKWKISYRNTDRPEEGIKMEIVLKRRITNELLTTYLPSILLILITYATTFFPAFYFEAAVTVNLTTMLVMTTLFIAVMDKLPSTAYIKAIDVWLIFGQLIPFISVVVVTLKEVLRAREGDQDGNIKVNHHGKVRNVKAVNPTTPDDVTKIALQDAPVNQSNQNQSLLYLDIIGGFLSQPTILTSHFCRTASDASDRPDPHLSLQSRLCRLLL